MPRRATPLDPEDGPEARFALALRQLRDHAGFEAKTIDAIAAENYIPRSTLYAAMRGKRIPTVPVLAALVHAWNGDPAEWLALRTKTEEEVERHRLQGMSCLRSERGRLQDVPQPAPAEIEAPAARDEAAQAARVQRDEGSEAESADESSPSDGPMPLEYQVRRLLGSERLRRLTDPDAVDTAEIWSLLRQRSGAPTVRDIARAARMRSTSVTKVLNGSDRSKKNVRRVLKVFDERNRLMGVQSNMRARGLM